MDGAPLLPEVMLARRLVLARCQSQRQNLHGLRGPSMTRFGQPRHVRMTFIVAAIEIYKGPATMPAEALGNACAAVYIWTRRRSFERAASASP